MFKKLFGKNGGGDPVEKAAGVCIQRQVEIESLDRERRELLAQRLMTEDDAGDVRAIDKLLQESERQIELARARLEKARRELVESAAASVSHDWELQPELQRDFQHDKPEAEAKALALAELTARWADAALLPELAAKIRAACVDPLTAMGFAGAADLYGRARSESARFLAEFGNAVGEPPADLRERKELIAQLAAGSKGYMIERRWKRALNRAMAAAGVKPKGSFEMWKESERAQFP